MVIVFIGDSLEDISNSLHVGVWYKECVHNQFIRQAVLDWVRMDQWLQIMFEYLLSMCVGVRKMTRLIVEWWNCCFTYSFILFVYFMINL